MTHRSPFRTRHIVAACIVALAIATPSLTFAGYQTMTLTNVAPNQTMVVSFDVTGSSPTPGAYPLADQIALYTPGAADGSYLSYVYVPSGQRSGVVSLTAPATEGVYEVRYQPYANGYHTTWTFPVMVLQSPYTVSTAETVTAGVPFSVSYVVPSGAPAPLGGSLRDQIGLYAISADDGLYDAFAFVPGGPRTGSVSITPPSTPGVYELRYQPYANGFRSVVVRTVSVLSSQPYTLSAPSSVPGDLPFNVAFTVPPLAQLPQGFPLQDYVALYTAGAPDGMYLDFAYVPAGQTSGSVELSAPAEGGAYELRYHSRNSGYHSEVSRSITVEDSLFGPLVKIQGTKTDENGQPDTTALVDPTGPGATCGPFPYDTVSQSKKSKACGPNVNPFGLLTRVSSRGYATLRTRFDRGKDVIVSICGGLKPYECTDHPPLSYCRPAQSSASAKLRIYVPPDPPAFIDMHLLYVPDAQGLTYPPCDVGSFPAVLSTANMSTGTLGDVTGDGLITTTDGVNALRCAAGIHVDGNCGNADTDCTGGATVTDGVVILRLAAGLPATVCGTPDPCHDAVACSGKNCGTVTNICQQPISCGQCTPPDSCGATGTPNVCGCGRDNAADCGNTCGTITNRCGDRGVQCTAGCPCPNPCGPQSCGPTTDCHGNRVVCNNNCGPHCPQPGQNAQGARCGLTTGLECCGFNCTVVPGVNGASGCFDRCGGPNDPCCQGLLSNGVRAPCNAGLACKQDVGFLGPFRCLP